MVEVNHALTLRSKGVNRHPYYRDQSLKRRSALGTFGDLRGVLGGPDTINAHLAPTPRSKGVHRHPYCRGLRVKMRGALRYFGDLGSLEVWTLSGTIMCRPCGQKESIDTHNVGLSLKNAAPSGPLGTPGGLDTV